MTKAIKICISIMLIVSTAYGQSVSVTDVSPIRPQYSKVDFFKDIKKLIIWNGTLKDSKKGFDYYSPTMSYNDLKVGYCRIICNPIDPKDRTRINTPFDGRTRDKEIRKIPLDLQMQKKYRIYGIFIQPKNLKHVDDSNNPNYQEPVFPCPAFIYEKKNDRWILINKTTIADDTAYIDLLQTTGTSGE